MKEKLILIFVVFALVVGFYMYFSPYQQCKRAWADQGRSDINVSNICKSRSW